MNRNIKLFFTGFSLLFCSVFAFSQPSFGLEDVIVPSESITTMKVHLMDYTDIISTQFSVTWNPTEVEYIDVTNLEAIPELNLGPENFDLSQIDNGKLIFKHTDPTGIGLTIPDNNQLREVFQISFRALIPEGDTAYVLFPDSVEEIIVIRNNSEKNIWEEGKDRLISGSIYATTPIPDIHFNLVPQEDKSLFCKGDQICYNLETTAFDSILSMQVALNWKGNVLEFDRVDNFAAGILNENSFNAVVDSNSADLPAKLTAIRIAETAEEFTRGMFLEDGTSLFSICFNVVGETESTTDLIISPSPNSEVYDVEETELEIFSNTQTITVSDCDQLVIFSAECPKAVKNDTICIDITSTNFTNINEVALNLIWDTDILEYVRTQDYNLPELGSSDFNVSSGSLVVDWTDPDFDGESLETGERMFSVCFKVSGEIDSIGFLQFVDLVGAGFRVVHANGERIDKVRFDNCESIRVLPPKVKVSAMQVSSPPNEEICVPIIVEEFNNIAHLEMPVSWDPSVLEFLDINTSLSGLGITNFDVSRTNEGQLQLISWDSPDPSGVSLDGPSPIFEICFRVIGDLNQSSPISFPNTEANPIFIRTASNQETGADTSNGLVEIASSGLVVSSDAQETEQGKSVCVDIRTSNFQEIVSLNYAHIWDPAVWQFDSISNIQLSGLSEENFETGTTGEVSISWNKAEGMSLDDGSVLYTLCFTAIGDLGNCGQFTIGEQALITSLDSEGTDIGLFDNVKDICIDNFGLTNIVIESPSCENQDGYISLTVSGDEGNTYVYQVSKDGQEFLNNADTRDNILLENLSEGEYCLSILTINNGKSLSRCFSVNIEDDEIPIPMAGADIDLGCQDLDQLEVQLDGDVIVGGVFSYKWESPDGGQIRPDDETVEDPVVTAPGTYILTVETRKCIASDTVVIFASSPPEIKLQPADILGCTNNTVQLDASGSSSTSMHQISWTTADGNIVSDSTSLLPIVDQAGTYSLTIIDTINGCENSASVSVRLDTIKPKANAGVDRQLGCEDDFVVVIGEGSSTGTGISYEWSTPDGSSIVNPNNIEAHVSRVGTYILTVTNIINNCQAQDEMMVIADESLPVARTKDQVFIGCGMSEVRLDGSESSQGVSFAYRWENSNQELISESDTITTSTEGQYWFIVTNIDNDDCISDSIQVNVIIDQNPPVSSITQRLTLDCKSECSDLSANVPEGDHYTYQWITDDGLICEGENSITAKVNSIALYKFIITDTRNNCADTSSTIVAGDGTSIIADAGPARVIGCIAEPVLLDGRGSTINENSKITWTDENGTIIATEITTSVSEPGEYFLTIVDEENGCNASTKVKVSQNISMPVANAGEDIQLQGCTFPDNLRLNGSLSESGDGIIYNWRVLAGGDLKGDTSGLNPEVTEPGTYQLVVTDMSNGCTGTDEVIVSSDLIIPVANGGPDQKLTCENALVLLEGGSEVPIGNNPVIKWTKANAAIEGVDNTLNLTVFEPGLYKLTIISEDGCVSSDEVRVSSDQDFPLAEAGEAPTISCNKNVFINGSGSTGPNMDVSWSTMDGNIISGADNYSVEINAGGTYVLTVTNMNNSCSSTAEVVVTSEGDLPFATAGVDQEICGNEARLNAELPSDGISGEWRTLEGSIILSPTDPASEIADLEEGINTYIWTLSTENCPSYSSDTLRVTVPTFPNASDDAFQTDPGQNLMTINLVENDLINSENFTINIINPPLTGELSETENGVFDFSAPARYFGTQEFQYEICNAICSELCDIAAVRIIVIPGADVDTTRQLPNAITPNGDGLNDRLLFDELIFDSSEFPKSELVIFNRWGNIVYRASPYNNDWNGINEKGEALPEGTYYFVLRLDIADGEGMKGDITILR